MNEALDRLFYDYKTFQMDRLSYLVVYTPAWHLGDLGSEPKVCCLDHRFCGFRGPSRRMLGAVSYVS